MFHPQTTCPFSPQMNVLLPIVRFYLDQIPSAEWTGIAAGETNSCTVITLAHMHQDLSHKLTEDFLTFMVPVLQSSQLDRTSSQAEVAAVVKTLEVNLGVSVSLALADVLHIQPPQCEDMKRLTALLETETKTRVSALLAVATRNTVCLRRHALFVSPTVSSISTLQLLVSHTLRCLRTSLGGPGPGQELEKPARRRGPPGSSFFHALFEGAFQKMLDNLHQLLQLPDQKVDSSSSNGSSPPADIRREPVKACRCTLTTHTVVRGDRGVLMYDTIRDQLENIYQSKMVVGAEGRTPPDVGRLARQMTDGLYEQMTTGDQFEIPDVPEGQLLSDAVVLDLDSDPGIMNTAVVYSRVEDAVGGFLQQVLLFLEMNFPHPASVAIDDLDTATPEDDWRNERKLEDTESSGMSTPEEVTLYLYFIFSLVSDLLKRVPNKSRRFLRSKDITGLTVRLLHATSDDIRALVVAAAKERRNLKSVVDAAVKHLYRSFESPEQMVELAFRPEDSSFIDAFKTFMNTHLTELMSAPPRKSRVSRFFSSIFSCVQQS